MFIGRLTELGIHKPRLLEPVVVSFLTKSRLADDIERCPGAKKEQRNFKAICDSIRKKEYGGRGGNKDSPGGDAMSTKLVRVIEPGKVRMGFIPEEWFVFFKGKTGVSGPYLLMLGLANYLCSKEIFVMEHEYYTGLSILLILYLVTTRFGSKIGAALDKEVDEVQSSFQKGRDDEIASYEDIIKKATLAQTRAKGQRELITAKKENISLQLEAVYRERLLMVYNTVRGRLEYHARRQRSENSIVQKWMIKWILDEVMKSITPEYQKASLKNAIGELSAMADQIKK